MPAQRENPPARPPDVAEEKLENRGSADDLHAGGMLRPTDGVTDRRRFVATRSAREDVGDLEEMLFRNAAELLDQVRRVAHEMALQDLEHASRMFERTIIAIAVLPRSCIVLFAVPS